jgi:hypothetical protein
MIWINQLRFVSLQPRISTSSLDYEFSRTLDS